MRRILTGRADTGNMNIHYELYQKRKLNGINSYSIKVKKGLETAVLADITSSGSKAKEFFDMLIRGCVTPVTASDVLEDWLLW